MSVDDSRVGSALGVGIGFSVGLALGSTIYSQAAVAISVTITSPVPGATFLLGVPTTVSGTSTGLVGDTVEASFESDFSVIAGTSGVVPAGGSWSLDAEAVLSSVGETTLYVREVGGSVALASQACVVPTAASSLHSIFQATTQDGTIVLGYYVKNGHTEAGTPTRLTALVPFVGGTAADVLIPGGGSGPLVNDTDAKLLGLPSVETSGTEAMQSTTPASSLAQAAPVTIMALGVPPVLTLDRWYDSAVAGCSAHVQGSPTTFYLYDGSYTNSGENPDNTQGLLSYFDVPDYWTTRKMDGTTSEYTRLASGGNGVQGATWFASNALTGSTIPPYAAMTIFAYVTSMSAADKTRWLHALQVLGLV